MGNQLTTESVTLTPQDSQEKQKKEQDQKRWHINNINGQSKIEIVYDRNDKQQEYKEVIYRCCSKNDVKNIHWKFHSPNQTIPIFMRGKRINLQPLIKESIIITKHDSQEKQKKEQDQKPEEISVGRDNQNKMKELSKQFPSPNQTIPNNVFQNLHRKPSSNPTIPKILQWRRVHLQSVKTMIKQYKTESIANHN